MVNGMKDKLTNELSKIPRSVRRIIPRRLVVIIETEEGYKGTYLHHYLAEPDPFIIDETPMEDIIRDVLLSSMNKEVKRIIITFRKGEPETPTYGIVIEKGHIVKYEEI